MKLSRLKPTKRKNNPNPMRILLLSEKDDHAIPMHFRTQPHQVSQTTAFPSLPESDEFLYESSCAGALGIHHDSDGSLHTDSD